MKFFDKMPISSGVVQSPNERDYLSSSIPNISYKDQEALLSMRFETGLGNEWKIFPIESLERLFGREGRMLHVLLRRKQKYRFLVALIDPNNSEDLIIFSYEPYLSLLAKRKNKQ